MTVGKSSKFKTLIIYRNIIFDDLRRCNIIPYSSESLIIDKLKSLFCLDPLDREAIILPSQETYILEYHKGFERGLSSKEMNEYEVFKIRIFRWLVGLPTSNNKDILVRFYKGRKYYLSFKDSNVDHNREFNIDVPEGINLNSAFEELFYGYTLEDIKKELFNIVSIIDKEHLGMVNAICRKINQYNLIR